MPPLCSDFDHMGRRCLGCYVGYNLNLAGECVLAPPQELEAGCSEYDANGNCIKCSFGFYEADGACLVIPPSCAVFDHIFRLCRGCYQGYELNDNLQCVESFSGALDDNCHAFDRDGVC